MTTTPTIWKSSFSPNSAPAGSQTVPQIISLANGNILVVWEDDTQGPGAFTDIMGQMLTPEGDAIGSSFQVNSAVTASDETGPKLVALPDGGYVVAYGSYLDALGGFIAIERFDANGNELSSRFILDSNSSLTDWDISADSVGNYTVVFERDTGSIDVHAITYDYLTNAAGVEHTNLAQNSSDDDRLGATAEFADGRVVTFYTEPDDWYFSYIPPLQVPGTTFEFTITDGLTGAAVRGATEIADPETRVAGRAQDVAILKDGQIVLLYSLIRQDGELAMKIVADGSSNGSISSEIIVDASFSLDGDGARGFENARVVALQDGGFLVAWIVDVFLYASRYDATGTPIGSRMIADQEVATGQTALFDLSLTTDGRVMIPFIKNTGEIAEVILDPRDNIIHGTEANDALTTQISDTLIYGEGGDDVIYGQGGNDTIYGGAGTDILYGGDGNDIYVLADVHRPDIFSNFSYDAIIESADGGTDTVYVSKSSFLVGGYTLAGNVENAFVEGADNFFLNGNASANALTGNDGQNSLLGYNGSDMLSGQSGDDYLDGGNGRDSLNGGQGTDTLIGGKGNDTYYLYDVHRPDIMSNFSYDAIIENEKGGIDTAYVGRVSNVIGSYALAGNVENAVITGTDNFSVSGNAAANSLTGNAGNNSLIGLAGNDVLFGNDGDDYLDGGSGRDDLWGGQGADTLIGGKGRDTLHYDLAGGGVRINLTVDKAAGDIADGDIISGCENTVGGAFDDNLIGNDFVNTLAAGDGNDNLVGRGASDRLIGGVGKDKLTGGSGKDKLTGGSGNDKFIYMARNEGGDTITDFSSTGVGNNDSFNFKGTAFGGHAKGSLAAAEFQSSNAAVAHTADVRFFYETDTGILRFDDDGNGAHAAIVIATLQPGATLSINDILIT